MRSYTKVSLVSINPRLFVFRDSSLHRTLRPHHTPPEELTHNPKAVLGALELTLEEVMLVRRFHLSLPDRLDDGILRGTSRALGILTNLVQTPLVKRMFAKEVDSWEVQCAPTRHASA